MSEFDRAANDILKRLHETFISSADDAIQHTWAKTIAHPSLGEEDEEFEVIDHSLTSDGIITEYYVKYKNKLIAVPADEAIIVVEKSHPPGSDEEHGEKPEDGEAEKLDPDEEEDSERKRSD